MHDAFMGRGGLGTENTDMANIYDPIDGTALAEGMQGSNACDEAWQAACAMAAERGSDVELEDDDGEWLVHPNGTRTQKVRCEHCGEDITESAARLREQYGDEPAPYCDDDCAAASDG